MTVRSIDDEHHVVRHCKKRQCYRTARGVKAFPDAFHLRPPTDKSEQEKYLSAIYYEFFGGEGNFRLRSCLNALLIKVKPKDALLRLHVGRAKEQGQKLSIKLRVTHEPFKECPAYAAIRGIPFKPNDELSNLLADLAVVEALEVSVIDGPASA